jgi:hypothetical protein
MSSGTPANPVARSNVVPNTIINMDSVYKQARNNARRRANNLERQRMAIVSAQRAARNANAARRAANIVGPTPTRRVRKKFTPSLASVPENNEMSGGRRSRKKSTRK